MKLEQIKSFVMDKLPPSNELGSILVSLIIITCENNKMQELDSYYKILYGSESFEHELHNIPEHMSRCNNQMWMEMSNNKMLEDLIDHTTTTILLYKTNKLNQNFV